MGKGTKVQDLARSLSKISSKNEDHEDKEELIETEERQQWSNPIEFLMSCISLSVGFGSK